MIRFTGCRPPSALALVVSLVFVAAAHADEAKPLEFQVTFDPAVSARPFTGRVYVMLGSPGQTEPRHGPNWFRPQPFFARDVKDWKPGEPITLGADALAFPEPMAKLARGRYAVQAVMDFGGDEPTFGTAAGNGYSVAKTLDLDGKASGAIPLVIDRTLKPRPFRETDQIKYVDIESKLLSTFHGRPVRMRASVILPASYHDKPEQRYPVIYEVPHFSGTPALAYTQNERISTTVAGVETLVVVLDPQCHWGHCVFADSDNNGPWGQALITELIPHIEKQYRALGVPTARFLTGHSSGGWGSLWLQVTYPDFFGGVWSTSPDPVDFHDFQQVNIYAPNTNLYFDEKGARRPLARQGMTPVLFYKPFAEMEHVMGRGGQLQSFEAVFSRRGANGRPEELWDRKTGAINPAVAESWKRYDIRLILERDWAKLGPKLAGKLHVFMGDRDTFYLDGATRLLKESLAKLGSDAEVVIFPGRDHVNLIDRNLRSRIAEEMAQSFRKHHPEGK